MDCLLKSIHRLKTTICVLSKTTYHCINTFCTLGVELVLTPIFSNRYLTAFFGLRDRSNPFVMRPSTHPNQKCFEWREVVNHFVWSQQAHT